MNVILLGDTLGDLTMADGMPDAKNILTIGFLNDHVSFDKVVETTLICLTGICDIWFTSKFIFELCNIHTVKLSPWMPQTL